MQFTLKLLAFSLAAASTAHAYPITEDNVKCRDGPSTSHAIVRAYPLGTDVTLLCQTPGEVIFGNSLWDKTTDGCFVTDYYVKTGSTGMVTGPCVMPGGAINDKISRADIMARAQFWVDKHVPYSMDASYPDPQGTNYRTDCSGFVSMALHTTPQGYSTVSLPDVAKSISWSELQAGDFVGTLGPGTGGAAGHVTIFHSWVDKCKKAYKTLECKGDVGCVAFQRPVGWGVGNFTAQPYRYTNLA